MTIASSPINTPGDTLYDPLDSSDFVDEVLTSFSAMPAWHVGKVYPWPATSGTPPLLTDPAAFLTAGYVHNAPSPTDPAYVPPGQPFPGFSWLPDELAVYPNGDAIAATGYSPFTVSGGVLEITAAPTPPAVLPYLPAGYSQQFVSGALCSYPFSQTYGYFEAMIKMPSGAGLWPAFWLLQVAGTWPPEIDVMEVLGVTPTQLYTTLHDAAYKTIPPYNSTQLSYGTSTVDLSQGYHLYGLDWGPQTIRFYLDQKLIFSEPTPPSCHKPFYWILNLAVGGPRSWGGPPDATTRFPATMSVAYVRTWQRRAYLTAGGV